MMTAPTDLQAESSPSRLLLVRYVGAAPSDWIAWGGHHPVPGVWRFAVADQAALIDLLERLHNSLPGDLQTDVLAAVGEPGTAADGMTLEMLAGLQSLPVLLTRLRHPWIMGELTEHIRSYLQPIVDLGRGGQLFAYEALCRGVAPDGSLLNGEQMFTLAGRASRLAALDTACQQSALQTKARLLPDARLLFINILPGNLLTLDLQQEPWRSLPTWGIRPDELVFEIIESERVDHLETLVAVTDRLRSRGFRIALDDVGSGYNGLAALAKLRPDFLKLDRGLVQGVQGSQIRLALVQALISMAQRLGCAIIAEGLERTEDIAVCCELGVHFGQGYYFGHPAPEPVLPRLLPLQPSVPRPARTNTVRLQDFIEPIPTLSLAADAQQAREYFCQYRDQPVLIVLDERKPVGYLTRQRVRFRQRDAGLGERCKGLDKILPEQMPARALAFRLYHDPDPVQPWVVVDHSGDYLGVLEPWPVLAQLFSGHPREGVHLLSHLPTGPVLRDTLDLQLREQKALALVYIDLDHFKAFNDRYGFVRGDAMIMLLAEVLRQTFRKLPETYLGHIGGDDFIAVAPRDHGDLLDVLRNLLISFRDLAAYLYDSDDLKRGYFTTEDGSPHPTAAISVVIVDGRRGQITDSLAASERVAQLKKLAKAQLGSVIATDDDPPRFLSIAATETTADGWEQRAIAALTDIAGRPRSQNHHDLDDAFKHYPFFELIYELDATGRQRYPNWVNPGMWGRLKGGGVGTDRSQAPYFQLAAGHRSAYVSNLYLSSASGEFCATAAVSLFNPAGEFAGVLVGDLNLTGLVALNAAIQQDED